MRSFLLNQQSELAAHMLAALLGERGTRQRGVFLRSSHNIVGSLLVRSLWLRYTVRI